MGLATDNTSTLWKDKALVEVNIAVLHSFQSQNITIMDHHTAAESFMKFFKDEQKQRGGCPADWVWIVPPISGSITPVFHQEMSLYHLKPSYEYQDPAWKTYRKKKARESGRASRFKEVAWAVIFTSSLFRKAFAKRTKVTILYATETGKSENYARKLEKIFNHAFNSQVYCMADYNLINIEQEALLLVVASTFGNGDPPENGEAFSKNLYAIKVGGTVADINGNATKQNLVNEEPLPEISLKRNNFLAGVIKMTKFISVKLSVYSQPDQFNTEQHTSKENGVSNKFRNSLNSEIISKGKLVSLNNTSFAVFALGSSAYPKFCAFGKHIDNLLGDLGGKPLMAVTCGDERAGQEQSFKLWSSEVFKRGCDTFCVNDGAAVKEATQTLKVKAPATAESLTLQEATKSDEPAKGLSRAHGKKIRTCQVLASKHLHGNNASRWTQQVIISTGNIPELSYQPGDHVAIIPANQRIIVDAVLARLNGCSNPDLPVKVMLKREVVNLKGPLSTWEAHEYLPTASVREMLMLYLDITSPPTPDFLHMLARFAQDNKQKTHLELLASDPHEYEKWKLWNYPHLQEVLEQFSSVKIDACVLLTHLPVLQWSFYSISSSPDTHPGQIHLTVAAVEYKTQGRKGPTHQETCSNFLTHVSAGDNINLFVRSASNFHMPSDPGVPIIMVGPGIGVAPFRGFWQQRSYDIVNKNENFGEMSLFSGCQTRALDLYAAEKKAMIGAGVLSQVYLALSREPNIRKTYVQDQLEKVGADVYRQVVEEKGHFYVCGGGTMAECVYQKLKSIVKEHGKLSDAQVEHFMLQMRVENRYHEDIYGILKK
ncbi:unnamed protein product, partial [Meganyctiphanes norvegica]